MARYYNNPRVSSLRLAAAEALDRCNAALAAQYLLEADQLAFSEDLHIAGMKIGAIWHPLGRVHPKSEFGRVIFECTGGRGTVTLTAGNESMPPTIEYCGSAGSTAEALIRGALHAKEFWNGKCRNSGGSEFVFLASIADELVGVQSSQRRRLFFRAIPKHRRAEADALKRLWQPILDRVVAESRGPTRPIRAGEPRSSSPSAPAFA